MPGTSTTIVFNIGAGGPQTITPAECAAGHHRAGDHRRHHAARLQRHANHRAERQRPRRGNGLQSTASNTTVRGLVINRFGHCGIFVAAPGGGQRHRGQLHRHRSDWHVGASERPAASSIFSAGNRVGGTTAASARTSSRATRTSGVEHPEQRPRPATSSKATSSGTDAGTAAVPNLGRPERYLHQRCVAQHHRRPRRLARQRGLGQRADARRDRRSARRSNATSFRAT